MKESIRKGIVPVFAFCVCVFMLLGIAIVAGQLIGVVSMQGSIAVSINAALKIWMIRFAVVAGILGYVAGYLKPKKA